MNREVEVVLVPNSVRHLLGHCVSLSSDKSLASVHDITTCGLAKLIASEERRSTSTIEFFETSILNLDGKEPSLGAVELVEYLN